MRNWSIPLGKLFGVEIRIHFTFLFLLAFVWMAESAMKGNSAPNRVLALVGIVFGSVVLHELGHALVAMREGLRAKAIILLPIGGITLLDDSQPPGSAPLTGQNTWKRDVRIAIAGSLVNISLAVIAGLIVMAKFPDAHLWVKPFIHSNHLLRSFVWVNLYLGAFNLLPAYPMDGGHVLRAIFSRRMDVVSATRRAVSIAHALAPLVIVVGMLLLFQGGHPDSYLIVTLGFFLLIGAQVEERSAVFQKVLETVHLEDVMLTDFATLSPADTLERFSGGARRRHGGCNFEGQHSGCTPDGRKRLRAVGHEPDLRSVVAPGLTGDGVPQAEFAEPEHHSGGRRPAPGWNHYPAKPDALHVAAGGEPQASQRSAELLNR
jgi:Zn-dependent protease